MRLFENHLTRRKLYAFLVLFILFTGFTCWVAHEGIDDRNRHTFLVIVTTAGTILGPMTGAISRNWQGCCTQFSLSLLPWCGGILGVGFAAQCIRLPFQKGAGMLRWFFWIVGWLGWFMGGFVSFLHAFS